MHPPVRSRLYPGVRAALSEQVTAGRWAPQSASCSHYSIVCVAKDRHTRPLE